MNNYNTQLPQITLPEYGRNIQQLVEYCKTIPDRQKRTRYAYGIVDIMADLKNNTEGVDDLKPILWDQLAMISNYELDVDYPFPITPKEKLSDRPEILQNPQKDFIRWRMYGKVVEDMIARASIIEDREQRVRLLQLCANHMKLHFHKTYPNADEDNGKIINDLLEYTRGKFADEIHSLHLLSIKELLVNDQYDASSLETTTKKKKKKKKK